jgi:hypothetical protein
MLNFGMVNKAALWEIEILLHMDKLVQETHIEVNSKNMSVVKQIFKTFQVTKIIQDMVKKPYWLLPAE